MDLSKAFDMINHSLLLIKLNSCEFSDQALNLLQSCHATNFRKTKMILLVAGMR